MQLNYNFFIKFGTSFLSMKPIIFKLKQLLAFEYVKVFSPDKLMRLSKIFLISTFILISIHEKMSE